MSKLVYTGKVPTHIGIIMDGNGRWAKAKHLPRIAGHKAGGDVLKNIVRACGEIGVSHLSVYAFSTENWKRPKEEVGALFKLLVDYCQSQVKELIDTNTKIVFIGDIEGMPKAEREAMRLAEQKTAQCTGLQFNICINYGGRQEIVNAVKNMLKSGIAIEDINQQMLSEHMYTGQIPDPEFIIRTSGEKRLSNFFAWQSVYSEFVFVDYHWPEFTPQHLVECIDEFNDRKRRFGGI